MKKFLFLTILIGGFSWLQNREPGLTFIDTRFDDFITRVVAPKDHQSFSKFYQKFIDKQKENKLRKTYLAQIRSQAYRSLSVKHPLWAKALEPYMGRGFKNKKRDEMHSIRTFLVRYGVYEEFLKQKALRHANIWAKMKSFTQGMRMKTAGMFSLVDERIT